MTAALDALASWAEALIDASSIWVAVRHEDHGPAIVRAAAGRGARQAIGRTLEALDTTASANGGPWLRVPIPSRGREGSAPEVGIVIARPRRDRPLDERDAELLRLLATEASIAVAQERADRQIAMLYELERRRAEQLEAAAEIGASLARVHRLADVLDLAVGLLSSRFGYDRVAIFLRDDDASDFVLRAATGSGPGVGHRLDLTQPTAVAWAARLGESQLIADRGLHDVATGTDGLAFASELAVPIGAASASAGDAAPDATVDEALGTTGGGAAYTRRGVSGVSGVLALAARRAHAFDASDLALAEAIADQLAIALENLRLAARAREDAAAAERARLARELHDDTAQQLVAIAQRLDAIEADLPAERHGSVELVRDMVDEALRNVRRISRALRPAILEDLGLTAALEALAADAERQGGGPAVAFAQDGEPRRLAPRLEQAIYRIAQEAVANALRHAAASRVEMVLRFEPAGLTLEVEDDGRGVGAPRSLVELEKRGGLGLLGMRERANEVAGRLEVAAGRAGGTTIRLTIPGA
jgi:signal transduction histidine kinase